MNDVASDGDPITREPAHPGVPGATVPRPRGSMVGFYGRDGLADMVGVSPDSSGFSGVVFNYPVRSQDRVNEVLDEAKKAGGKILKPAAQLKWGGYGGSFADPDGYIWNIGYSAEGKDQPYAE
jgi:predicted enzyme related to lactoylglutathione lyase